MRCSLAIRCAIRLTAPRIAAQKSPSFQGLVNPMDPRKSRKFQELPRYTASEAAVGIPQKETIITSSWIFLNTISTLGLVFLGKRTFDDVQLKNCQLMVVGWHFTATGLVLFISTKWPFHAFRPTRVNTWNMLPVCAFFVAYVVLGNLSLTLNSIGFYQLSKVLTTPTVVLINFLLFRKSVTRWMLCSILVTCLGISFTISQTVGSAPRGVIVAVMAFVSTALYQIWIGKKIEDFAVSPPQFLLNQAPLSVLMLTPFVSFIDRIPDISTIPKDKLYSAFLSGIMASLYNLSQFVVVGRTSALTFNIVSHIKTILVMCFGWYQEGRVPSSQDRLGVVLALGGGLVYSHLAIRAALERR